MYKCFYWFRLFRHGPSGTNAGMFEAQTNGESMTTSAFVSFKRQNTNGNNSVRCVGLVAQTHFDGALGKASAVVIRFTAIVSFMMSSLLLVAA